MHSNQIRTSAWHFRARTSWHFQAQMKVKMVFYRCFLCTFSVGPFMTLMWSSNKEAMLMMLNLAVESYMVQIIWMEMLVCSSYILSCKHNVPLAIYVIIFYIWGTLALKRICCLCVVFGPFQELGLWKSVWSSISHFAFEKSLDWRLFMTMKWKWIPGVIDLIYDVFMVTETPAFHAYIYITLEKSTTLWTLCTGLRGASTLRLLDNCRKSDLFCLFLNLSTDCLE